MKEGETQSSDLHSALVHIVNVHYKDIIGNADKSMYDALYESRQIILDYLDDREEKALILEKMRKDYLEE